VTDGLLLREVLPATLAEADLATDAGRAWLDERYARPGPFVRINMITSLTGAAVGADGTSETLTNRVDRAILGGIRRTSDAVIVGAQTVRSERLRRPRTGTLAVVTARGVQARDAGGLAPAEDRTGEVLIVCPEHIAPSLRADADALGAVVVAVPDTDGRPSPAAIVAALNARGLSRLVCEGGPNLASQFVASGVVDELCVTVAPVVGAAPPDGPFLRLPVDAVPRTLVTGMLVDEAGFSYLRLATS
jgi:riboflavin biosynthesis pyrimidine reductase